MEDHERPIWKIELDAVKNDVEDLASVVKELAIARMSDREVIIELKVWMRVVAAIWAVIALIIAGVAVKLLVG